MPRVSAKRQITLPVRQCNEAGIAPGDEFRSFVANGRITITRQVPGSAWGCVRHLESDATVSENESRDSALGRVRG